MSVETLPSGNYRVVWRDENGQKQTELFAKGRKAEAQAFDGEMKMRKLAGTTGMVLANRQTLAEYWAGPFADHLASKAPKTAAVYSQSWRSHIEPRLGNVPLSRLGQVKRARHFLAQLQEAGVKPSAADKAMSVLSAILGLAETDELIPANPVPKLKRKRPQRRVVRPLAPATVEAIRGGLPMRDAMVVSLLAYSGMRPHELCALPWHAVGERILSVPTGTKTGDRPVRLLAPLKADLAEWRMACGRPDGDEYVMPAERAWGGSTQWRPNGFEKWAQRVFGPAVEAVGRPDATPYYLRHSFASLLAHEGRSVVYIAKQLGHGADLSVTVYQHVIDELEGQPAISAEDAIRAAREALTVRSAGT